MRLNKTPEFERVTEDIGARASDMRLSYVWRKMTDEHREQFVRPLMEVGHSNTTAGYVLGVTKGQVAGLRHRIGIPSRNCSGFAALNVRSLPNATLRSSTRDQVADLLRWRAKKNRS